MPKVHPNDVDLYADGFAAYVKKSVNALLFENFLNVLMLCVVPAVYLVQNEMAPGMVFLFSLLAIAPFAERLSFVTEQLALHTSDTLGGLLNATFGNVTELIVSVFALTRGMRRIVQVSLLGSILSNLLLVLGCAFFAGGVTIKLQKFNKTSTATNIAMLVLTVIALAFPMMLETTHDGGESRYIDAGLTVSRSISVLLLFTYCCYIYFQLYTHTHIFEEEEGDDDDDDEDDDEEPILGVWGAIFWLAVITVFISILSEYMVDSLEEAAVDWGLPDLFLGTIIIPIVGNAAEHAAAIIFAVKNKMELALGIAVGSAVQIGAFCVPLLIVIGWASEIPLSLNFHPFETLTLLATILLVGFVILNGESNWLVGVMLIVAYCCVAAGFFVHVDDEEGEARLRAL
jgi:Ca2+:H+ antiporter